MHWWKSFVLSLCLWRSVFIQGFLLRSQNYRRLQIHEATALPKNETNCVIFFTGGSNAISHTIYSDFFHSLNQNNISVYSPCFKYRHIPYLTRILDKNYKKVIMIGQSSGCTTMLNQCENQTSIQNVVLLDPVNTKIMMKETFFRIPFIRKILFLHAEKSYKISVDPFGLPFIPFFRLHKNQLKGDNVDKIMEVTLPEHGHSDILNPVYSNIMHFTRITVGHKNRTYTHLRDYHQVLSKIIYQFMED